MNLLLLTDVHGAVDRLERIIETAGEVDYVLLAGDLTDFGPPGVAEEVVDVLQEAAPVLAVPGNCDPDGVDDVLEERGVQVDGRIARMDGYQVAGLGGSNPTPFNTDREFTEEELAERLEVASDAEDPWILVTHAPPKNSLDLTQGAHVGSSAVFDAVERRAPVLVATGHVHESRGDMFLGGSLVVNPGPAMSGRGAVVTLNGDPEVRYLKVK
ncbi:MAG: 3',5'-cyclic adenosine monophosphate phosphodiesterase CpdA [Methanonatronarchaeales archaeon]|nr:3',5'-cyclic adenosine monophosphate phosphodiesterase CpdA [Methanonatronarchaeales archaeon]